MTKYRVIITQNNAPGFLGGILNKSISHKGTYANANNAVADAMAKARGRGWTGAINVTVNSADGFPMTFEAEL